MASDTRKKYRGKKFLSSKRKSRNPKRLKRRLLACPKEDLKIHEPAYDETEEFENMPSQDLWNMDVSLLFQNKSSINLSNSDESTLNMSRKQVSNVMEDEIVDVVETSKEIDNDIKQSLMDNITKSNETFDNESKTEKRVQNDKTFPFGIMFVIFATIVLCCTFISFIFPYFSNNFEYMLNKLKYVNKYSKVINCKRRLHWHKTKCKKLRKKFKKQLENRKRNVKKMNKFKEANIKESLQHLQKIIKGRRIVDFDYFWNEVVNQLGTVHNPKCKFTDWKLVKESFRHGGLRSLFFFSCKRCKKVCKIWSEPMQENIMELNQSSVLGSLAAGMGFSHIQTLFATMNIPYVDDKTFKSHQDNVLFHLEHICTESMKAAGKEEFRLAEAAGDVVNGIPFITVVVDGTWLKRTFGNKYDSLSGAATIIGKRTGKVLFVGVKNKYCTSCFRSQNAGKQSKEHNCYRNFPQESPSTLMESAALVEGFKESLDTHGLIYRFIIGDGDSNFYKKLIDDNPYANLNIMPRKIECTNHLLRNFCKKNASISNIRQKKGERIKGFVTLRNVVKNNVLNIRQAVIESVDRQLTHTNKSWESKVKDLQREILNVPSHVFNEHKRCQLYGLPCSKKIDSSNKETNYVPHLKSFGLYQKVEEYTKLLSCHAESLLHKVNNNDVESFNSIICKHVAGKRINFALTNQYNTRVYISVIHHNSGQKALSEIFKGMEKEVPDIVTNLEEQRILKNKKNKETRITHGRKRQYTHFSADENYGPKASKLDLSEDQLIVLREQHFAELRSNQENREQIELDTRNQSQSDYWQTLRKKHLTASHYGSICRKKNSTSCRTIVKSILYSSLPDTAAMMYGRANEDIARKEIENETGLSVQPCGLFIDPIDSRFAASPDGIIDDDGLVEIKNPYRAVDLTAKEAMEKYPDLNFIDKRTKNMKKTHHWYYQIQGQLHVTNRSYCLFALRTPKTIEILKVKRDDEFWIKEMEPHLSKFYDDCLLPEILDSRYLRSMPIRDPDYILKAQDEVIKNKEEKKSISKKNSQLSATTNIGEEMTAELKAQKLISNFEMDVSTLNEINNINDECVIVSESNDESLITLKDILSIRKYLESRLFSITANEVKAIVLSHDAWLSCDALDAFLGVVRKEKKLEVESVQYITSPASVKPAQATPSAVILGGLCTKHWRLGIYKEEQLFVYDTIENYTGGKLIQNELEYVFKRFPNLTESDIIFAKMRTKQPNSNSCGVYAASLLTYFAIKGEDPSKVSFSMNAHVMRQHYFKILQKQKLMLFPLQSACK